MENSVIGNAGAVRSRRLLPISGLVSFEWATIEKGGRILLLGGESEILPDGRINLAWTTISGAVEFGKLSIADGGFIDVSNMTVQEGGRVSLDKIVKNGKFWLSRNELTIDPGGRFNEPQPDDASSAGGPQLVQ